MNFEQAVRDSSVIRQEHKDPLLEHLRRIPEFSWLLGLPNPHNDRLQGDFFRDFPVVFLKPDGTAVQNRRPVMILNNTCDLPAGRSTFVSMAPVFDLEKFLLHESGKREKQSLADFERTIRDNKVSNLLYVPHLADFKQGAIVRLDMICSVAFSFLDEAVADGRRLASFTQSGFYLMLMKMTYHLTRSESPDISRTQ